MSQFGFATLRKQAGALGARDEASDRKTADFMMDGVYFGALSVVFGTVRQFFRHFDDGRSDGWLDEWAERRLPRRFVLSIKMGDFVDEKLCLRSVARKKADFMAEKVFLRSPAKIRGIFLAGWFADKKRDTLERMSL